ncbi:MAG: hypothetical protein HGN29_13930 [Asgard group archaeon]|nr:hypothetical protein [Asgard group archaeon]
MKLPLELRNKVQKFSIKNISREKLNSFLLVVAISIVIFILSLYFKNLVSEWYWRNHGTGFYWTRYDGSTIISTWYIEAYSDASYYYEPYLNSFRYDNWNPYAGGEGPLNGYAYGPMFIYGLYFISVFMGLFNPGMDKDLITSESVKWTHITFDALSVVMLYIIIISLKSFRDQKKKKHFLGVLGSLVFLFMPLNLLYVDSIFLNTPQMTFFTLLSFLFFLQEKYRSSAFILSVAWLSKQMPLFLVIPWFFIIWKKRSLKEALVDFIVIFIVSTLILSIPWLFLSPKDYVWRVFGPGKPLSTVDFEHLSNTVSLAHSFLFFGSESFANFYSIINKYMIPFIVFYILVVLFAYFNGKKIGNDENQFTIFTTWIIINTHLFISRGVYKYYNAFITPFVVISFLVFSDQQASNVMKKIESRDVLRREEIEERTYQRFSLINQCLLFLLFFVSLSSLFYYYNLVLITKSRFLHPFLLLILFLVISILLSQDIYRSLLKKENYKMIIKDLKDIFQNIVKYFKKVKDSFIARFRKES